MNERKIGGDFSNEDAAVRRCNVSQQSPENPRSAYPLPSIPPATGSPFSLGPRLRSGSTFERRCPLQHSNREDMLPPFHKRLLRERR